MPRFRHYRKVSHMIDLTGVIKNIWPEWQVERLLGQGSFGRVYEVSRKELDIERRSAVKVILVPPDTSEANALRLEGMTEDDIHTYYRETVKDFVSEIRLLNTLQGAPHIVNLEDFKVVGSKSGEMWCILIRMELLTPFTQHIAEHPMDEAEVIRLGAELCEALEICHGQNIIHRDIKPQNIFIDRYGSSKLGDFGIARKMEGMTSTLSQKGTFGYIAPEVVQGRKYDTRADIYSLGLVLYQLMNEGRAPFLMTAEDQRNPRTRDEAMQRRLGGEQLPKPRSASSEFGRIILKACEYDPEKRFSNAAEMKDALLLLTEGRSATTKREERKSGVDGTKIPDANQTVAVRHAGQPADDQHTVAVRKAVHYSKDIKGTEQQYSKRKTSQKTIMLVIAILAVLALTVGGLFALPMLKGNNGINEDNEEAAVTSEIDRTEDTSAEQEEEKDVFSSKETDSGKSITEPAVLYSVMVSTDGHGEASALQLSGAPGDTVKLTSTPDEGYYLDTWEVLSGSIKIEKDEFQFGEQDVELRAIFLAGDKGQCGDNITWKFNSETGELIFSGKGDMWDYDLNQNKAPWLKYASQILRITIEDGISSIGTYAFYAYTNTNCSLSFPNSLKKMGLSH